MQITKNTSVEYLTLGLTIVLTLVSIYILQITVFYMIYLFWWDEAMRTIFEFFRFVFKRKTLIEPKKSISGIGGKFFFLFVYLIFIVVFLGFVMNWNNHDLVLLNGEVLFFQNKFFNISLVGFFLRETYILIHQDQVLGGSLFLSRGIITLHISLILGIFGWFLINNVFPNYIEYASLVAAIPFLFLKVIFEIAEIRDHERQRKLLEEENFRVLQKQAYLESLHQDDSEK